MSLKVDDLGCAVPEATRFAAVGTSVSMAQLEIGKIKNGGVTYSRNPQVINLLSQAATDKVLLDYYECRANKEPDLTVDQKSYFRRLRIFMEAKPTPADILKWQESNPWPERKQDQSQKAGIPPLTSSQPEVSNPEERRTLLSRDMGSLRVLLTSVQPTRFREPGGMKDGIRCTFIFINRDPQRSIDVALNAIVAYSSGVKGMYSSNSYPGSEFGDTLRTLLVDDRGVRWRLPREYLMGVSAVGVGKTGPFTAANATDIAALLKRRDDTGADTLVFNDFGIRFVYGSTSQILPGEQLAVTMDFEAGSLGELDSAPPKTLQLNSEIVIGAENNTRRRSYSLQNLVLSDIPFPWRQR